MKNTKKVISLVLALMMVFSITCTTAFAAEDNDHLMPEGLIGNTIAVTVEPGEDAGIMPLIWDQKYPAVGNVPTNTSEFTVPDRYFAYECVATNRETGGTADGSAIIELYQYDGQIDSLGIPIDGESYKADWIDLHGSDTTCHFKIRNTSDDIINVLITYYSWK